MTHKRLKGWLRAEIAWLQAHEGDDDERIFYDAAVIVNTGRRLATAAGLPDVARVLVCSSPAVAPITAQAALSAALAAMPDDRLMTPPAVARRYGVSPDAVRGWIRSGELRAINVAGKGKRPMHRVHPDALAEFDARRQTAAPQPARRGKPRKADLIVKIF